MGGDSGLNMPVRGGNKTPEEHTRPPRDYTRRNSGADNPTVTGVRDRTSAQVFRVQNRHVQRGLQQAIKMGDFLERALQGRPGTRLSNHHKWQIGLVVTRLLQNRVNIDLLLSQCSSNLRNNSRTVFHDKPNIMRNEQVSA